MPYVPQRIPLYTTAANRESSVLKDARLVNCWVEKDAEGKIHIQKRPALVRQANVAPSGTPGLGVFQWDDIIYAIFGGTLYGGTLGGLFTPRGSVANGFIYHFTSTLGAVHKLFFHDGNHAYVYDPVNGVVPVTDPDFPLISQPLKALASGTAYLDGVVYVARKEGATIFGSDFNDPLSWPADNFIVAQIEPDDIVFLAKHLIYIIASKQWSTEVFHDAANATGSPLAPDQGIKMNFGCALGESWQDVGGDLMWVSSTREGSVSVVHLSNLRAQIVSTPAIERQLEEFIGGFIVKSWSGRVGGHRIYAITLPTKTLVYDLTMGLWYEWTGEDGGPFPISSSTSDTFFHKTILQNATDGDIYTLELGTYRDDDGVFPVDVYTPNYDGETRVRKQMSRLELIGDQEDGDVCYIRVSDDDYQTWSDFRVVDRSFDRQMLFNCGTFYRRAFHIHHQSDKAFRVQALEGLVALGSL